MEQDLRHIRTSVCWIEQERVEASELLAPPHPVDLFPITQERSGTRTQSLVILL